MTSLEAGPADIHKPSSLDPLVTSRMLEATHRRYLKSLLPLREPLLATALAQAVDASPMLSKPPLLEATPPYATGATLRELIAAGVLDSKFTDLASSYLPLDRPFYHHQEQALRKAQSGRNLVVATGTGSGKTESFLLPILNALTVEHAAGTLGPGVRALLLYPMNALANDQLKRLRQLLAGTPQFTFGRYTGDTLDDAARARSQFEMLNPGQPLLSNELLSRQEMRQRPPHLLLTNYAMLEYLLLRPADLDLFQGDHAGQWRFIALDEAHVYDGAKAAEVAMLLRRLRDRVGNRDPQCIATSATVGDDAAAVVSFAERLFGVPFEWAEDDPNRRDLVRASRLALPKPPFWGPLSADDYIALAESEKVGMRVVEVAAAHGRPGDDPRELIISEERMADARMRLAERPIPFDELAAAVFSDAPDPAAALGALVTVGTRTRNADGTAALGARYHQFLRATEGAFACLGAAGPHVALSRHEICTECDAAMFEIGSCRRCGGVYLLGEVRAEDGTQRFLPRLREKDKRTWLAVGEDESEADEDDETLTPEVADAASTVAFLCVQCGALHPAKVNTCGAQGCTETQVRPVRRLKTHEDRPSVCLTCGARGETIIRRFESGNEAPAAVLTSALYQALPEAPVAEMADQPGGGRKLLLFSDSRQQAAYFAPYLTSSYSALQRRRLIYDGLRRAAAEGEPVGIEDLEFEVRKVADKAGVFTRRQGAAVRRRAVELWIMQELLSVDIRITLEGCGLVRVTLDRDPRVKLPPPLTALGLTDDECWDLLAQLATTVRSQGAVSVPEDVDPRDEGFDPRRGPIYLRGASSDRARKVMSWMPVKGSNRRVDYLRSVLAATGSDADAVAVLQGCWDYFGQQKDGWFTRTSLKAVGEVRQLNHRDLRIVPTDPGIPVYRCGSCRTVTAWSVRSVCPVHKCNGRLVPYAADPLTAADDHYRHLYSTMTPIPLTAMEHTAQWNAEEAARIQQQFLVGEVNVLSCSTTFELGVDVGETRGGVPAQHAADDRQLHPEGRPGRPAYRLGGAGGYLRPTPSARSHAIPGSCDDGQRQGPGPAGAARQRTHRPTACPLDSACRLLQACEQRRHPLAQRRGLLSG